MHQRELPGEDVESYKAALSDISDLALDRLSNLHHLPTTSTSTLLNNALENVPWNLPNQGKGLEEVKRILINVIRPAMANHTSRYYGFVTGGCFPSASLTDWFVSLLDANVQVHLPKETIATTLENVTIQMLLQLLRLSQNQFSGTFTTGATTSNLLALACARESQMAKGNPKTTTTTKTKGEEGEGEGEEEEEEEEAFSIAEYGFGASLMKTIKVFVARPHASIKKAVGMVGIGRRNVTDVGVKKGTKAEERFVSQNQNQKEEEEEAWKRVASLEFDLEELERQLKIAQEQNHGRIVVLGMGEVNTGALTAQTPAIHKLCRKYEAWLHIDAAFSAFVGLLPQFQWLSSHLSLADSITSDGHKTLNVPYDCGLLFVKKGQTTSMMDQECLLDTVCGPGKGPGPSYLASSSSSSWLRKESGDEERERQPEEQEWLMKKKLEQSLPSPLNRNLENSRRFRALPVYAVLLSQGRDGLREMVERNIVLRRRIEEWLRFSQEGRHYQVLTPACGPLDQDKDTPQPWKGDWNTTVVIFRPHPTRCPIADYIQPTDGHVKLADAIKATRKVYVSPTVYENVGAIRIAVSHWAAGLDEQDFTITTQVLSDVMAKK